MLTGWRRFRFRHGSFDPSELGKTAETTEPAELAARKRGMLSGNRLDRSAHHPDKPSAPVARTRQSSGPSRFPRLFAAARQPAAARYVAAVLVRLSPVQRRNYRRPERALHLVPERH